jgi:hypothetical protein
LSAPTHSNAAEAQRARLLAALSTRAVTTLQARRELDILHPAMRVLELRRLGHPIATVWTTEATECGKPHRVALYALPGRRR